MWTVLKILGAIVLLVITFAIGGAIGGIAGLVGGATVGFKGAEEIGCGIVDESMKQNLLTQDQAIEVVDAAMKSKGFDDSDRAQLYKVASETITAGTPCAAVVAELVKKYPNTDGADDAAANNAAPAAN